MNPCDNCGGSGKVHSHNNMCWVCNGTGKVKAPKNRNTELVQTGAHPEVWTVETIDSKSGDVWTTHFAGPDARQRAQSYMLQLRRTSID